MNELTPLIGPFFEFAFMRQALLGCVALSLSAAPVGVFLMLRRMSLTGDAMAHAILPGAAIGYLMFGLSLTAMTVGGIIAGMAVAVGSGLVTRNTLLREDTSLAAFYLLSLALGVFIVSVRGNSVDLLHVLFGTVLALDGPALTLLTGLFAVGLGAFEVVDGGEDEVAGGLVGRHGVHRVAHGLQRLEGHHGFVVFAVVATNHQQFLAHGCLLKRVGWKTHCWFGLPQGGNSHLLQA